MEGGKQAVGGKREAATGIEQKNDAVDFFYKTQGFHQLFTRVQVFFSISFLSLNLYSLSLQFFFISFAYAYDFFCSICFPKKKLYREMLTKFFVNY